MSIRTPLGKVRGLGSAHDGTGHWWAQRLTAGALIPLVLWFVTSMAGLARADYETATAWLASPISGILMLLFIVAGFYHMKLGIQVVIEDYVHERFTNIVSQSAVTFFTIAVGLACAFAVVKLSFGGF